MPINEKTQAFTKYSNSRTLIPGYSEYVRVKFSGIGLRPLKKYVAFSKLIPAFKLNFALCFRVILEYSSIHKRRSIPNAIRSKRNGARFELVITIYCMAAYICKCSHPGKTTISNISIRHKPQTMNQERRTRTDFATWLCSWQLIQSKQCIIRAYKLSRP